MQVYWSSIFILPKSIILQIEQILSNFLWKGPNLSRYGAKVAWSAITLPLQEGGLGLKSIREWNLASMARHIWNLQNIGVYSIWDGWARINLVRNQNFWTLKIPGNCSWSWRKILQLREKIRPLIRVRIGNGMNTSLWYDNWLSCGPIQSYAGDRVIYDSGLGEEAKVNAILEEGGWRWPPCNTTDLMELKYLTQNIIVRVGEEDRAIWTASNNEVFSINSSWNHIRTRAVSVSWASMVWFYNYIPKASFILWLAVQGRLMTQDKLLSFGVIQAMSCWFCNEPIENHGHLFFDCIYTQNIWNKCFDRCNITPGARSWGDMIEWGSKLQGKFFKTTMVKLMISLIIYNIWRERNLRAKTGGRRSEGILMKEIAFQVQARMTCFKGYSNSSDALMIDDWHC